MTQVQAPQVVTVSPGSTARSARRRRGRIGPVAVGQIVVAEVGLVAVGAVLDQPVWLVAVVASVATLALVAAFARRRGRWWYEDLGLRRRLRQRTRRAGRPAAGGSADDPRLTALAPDLTLVEVIDRGGRFGIGQDEHGWFLACVVAPEASDPEDPVEASTVDQAARALSGYTGPGSAAQVVARTLVERPESGGPARHVRDVWVAVRLSVSDAREEAVSRGGGVPGVHRTMAAVAGRLGKALTGAGLAYQVLDPDELREAVISAAGLDLVTEPQTESWTGLTGGGWSQSCLELRPRSDTPYGPLVDAVTATSVTSHTFAVPVVGGRTGLPRIRVAALDPELTGLLDAIGRVAGEHSATSRRLDGRHGPAIYATAPVAVDDAPTGAVPVRV